MQETQETRGWIPDPGRFYMRPRKATKPLHHSFWACPLEPGAADVSPCATSADTRVPQSPCSAGIETTAVRSPCTTAGEQPPLATTKEKPRQQQRLSQSEINEYSDPVPWAELGSEMTGLGLGTFLFHPVKLVLMSPKSSLSPYIFIWR